MTWTMHGLMSHACLQLYSSVQIQTLPPISEVFLVPSRESLLSVTLCFHTSPSLILHDFAPLPLMPAYASMGLCLGFDNIC